MIEKAIETEQKYLQRRLMGEDVVLDLSEYGYKNLDEYFADKRDYQLKHCNIKIYETTMDDIGERVESAIENKIPSIWIPTADSTFVWHGNEPIDFALCEELGVHVYDMNYNGGTIVSGEDDLSFLIIVPETIDIDTSYILNRLQNVMLKYFNDVVISGNDILINGMKVLGSMNRRVNGMYIFACQVSYSNHLDFINKLCSKSSDKIPGFINKNQMPREVLKNEVLTWLL